MGTMYKQGTMNFPGAEILNEEGYCNVKILRYFLYLFSVARSDRRFSQFFHFPSPPFFPREKRERETGDSMEFRYKSSLLHPLVGCEGKFPYRCIFVTTLYILKLRGFLSFSLSPPSAYRIFKSFAEVEKR